MKYFLPKLAFKNIRRNKRRTILSGSAITIVTIVVCLLFTLQESVMLNVQKNVINDLTGNIRLRDKRFTANQRLQPLQYFVPQSAKLAQQISFLPEVTEVDQRINTGISVYRQEQITPAKITGLNFDHSRIFKNENTQILAGAIPQQNNLTKKSVVVTQLFAQKHQLKLNQKFTFFCLTANGCSNGTTVTIKAIVHLGNNDFNGQQIFMDWQELSQLLRMQGNATDLLIYTKDNFSISESSKLIKEINKISKQVNSEKANNLTAEHWTSASFIYEMFKMSQNTYLVMAILFFLLSATVIFNTTMMSVLERKQEIGSLMSLGLERKKISLLFLIETSFISLAATLLGLLIAALLITVWHYTGLDLNALGGKAIQGMSFSDWIYPSLSGKSYLLIFFLGNFISIVACIHPARLALKIEPAEALRSEN